MTKSLRTKFKKVYANIPLGARDEIVAIVNADTLTFKQIYWMIENKVANQIVNEALTKMEAMKLL